MVENGQEQINNRQKQERSILLSGLAHRHMSYTFSAAAFSQYYGAGFSYYSMVCVVELIPGGGVKCMGMCALQSLSQANPPACKCGYTYMHSICLRLYTGRLFPSSWHVCSYIQETSTEDRFPCAGREKTGDSDFVCSSGAAGRCRNSRKKK